MTCGDNECRNPVGDICVFQYRQPSVRPPSHQSARLVSSPIGVWTSAATQAQDSQPTTSPPHRPGEGRT
jgi:hypothetical protein